MKALIVERSRLVALMLSSMFAKHGIESVHARNGADALALLARQHFDMLCMAYELDDMTGIEFFAAAKKRVLVRAQPALLFASTRDKKIVVRALEAGITECFAKNRMGELDDFVGKFSRGSQARLSGTVLLVEDSATAALFCRQVLEHLGLTVELSKSAEQAIELFAAKHFDLVITDYVLAGTETALALIRDIRASAGKKAQTPILAMSALNDTARKVEILRNGANDFIAKPLVAEEFEMRVANQLTMSALVKRLESQQEAMQDLAMHDQLTGLFNRYYLADHVPPLFADCQRRKQPLSLLICDIDHFKRVNDSHGHKTGDAVLEAVASQLQGAGRNREIVARVGGEEFVIIMPNVDLEQALTWAETQRAAIAALQPGGIAVTVSFGVAKRQADEDYETLFKRADAAVYQAKEAGRNRVAAAA